MPGSAQRPGSFHMRGAGEMTPTRGDGYLTTAEAARLVGVKPPTIRSWRQKGYLAPQGLDERGHPLHTREAVRAADRIAQANGIVASGIDPRLLRTGVRDAVTAAATIGLEDGQSAA
jgi:Helix-turn-helix domain